MKNTWTKEETEILINNYNKLTINEISKLVNKKKCCVTGKVTRLKLGKKPNLRQVTFSEEEFIRTIANSRSHRDAARKLGYKADCGLSSNNKKKNVLYKQFLDKIKPDLSHFCIRSKSCIEGDKSYKDSLNFERLYLNFKKQARRRKIHCDLSLEDYIIIVKQNCYYCNVRPTSKDVTTCTYKNKVKFNGVDRVDSNVGYLVENCVPCCYDCNIMKHTKSGDYFIKHCERVTKYQKRKMKGFK
jgi:hypothetical protein